MKTTQTRRITCWVSAAAVALTLPTVILSAQELPIRVSVQVDGSGAEQSDAEASVEVVAEPEIRVGKYWIGVQCDAIDAVLKTHLHLEHGLLVAHVVPESPAAKAGLQEHDVLVSAGDQKLTDIGTLIDAVEAAGTGPLQLTMVRQGKNQTVSVTPAERPADASQRVIEALENAKRANKENFFEWSGPDATLHEKMGKDGLRMLLVKPGMVLPNAPHAHRDWPDDLEISIHRKGDQPAKITVKRGEDSWEVSEDQLDELPEDIRDLVRPMLGQKGVFHFTPPRPPQWRLELPEGLDKEGRFLIMPEGQFKFEDFQLKLPEELRGRIDQRLDKAVEKLEAMKAEAPHAEAVQKLRDELQALRKELHELRKELKDRDTPQP